MVCRALSSTGEHGHATLISDGGQRVLARLFHRHLLPLLCRWDATSSEVRRWFGVPFLVCVTALRGLEISGRSIGLEGTPSNGMVSRHGPSGL